MIKVHIGCNLSFFMVGVAAMNGCFAIHLGPLYFVIEKVEG